jgi:hypothetical protein
MKIKEFLNEVSKSEHMVAEAQLSKSDLDKIKQIVKDYKFLSLRDPLKAAGFAADFTFSPVAHYQVGKGKKGFMPKIAIMNKKYADKAIFTSGEVAVELM